jgi:hypothetical protein
MNKTERKRRAKLAGNTTRNKNTIADRFLCGVPHDECEGAKVTTSAGVRASKAHSSSEEAFNCHKRWLIKRGYKQIGTHEFQFGAGPIVVLSKKSKFGGRLRPGKLSSRSMPHKRTGGSIF